VVPRPTPEADPEDFSLKISSSLSKARKLFNPDTDPIPMRRIDPEPVSGSTASQQAPALFPLHRQQTIEMREVTARDTYSIIERTIWFVFP